VTTTWSLTREQVRDAVLRKLGVLGAGESATPEDAAIIHEALDGTLKSLHHLGLLWWRISAASTSVALTAGQDWAPLPADLLLPLTLAVVDGGAEAPVTLIGHAAYRAIPDKATRGVPQQAMFDMTAARVWLYPLPAADGAAHLTYQRMATDSADGQAPDVPSWALLPLRDLVAYRVADDFGLPEDKTGRFALEAREAERLIRILNIPRTGQLPVFFSDF